MYRTGRHRFLLLITIGLLGYNLYDLFQISGSYMNQFRLCFGVILLLSIIKYRTIQKKGDYVFSGLFSLLRYLCSVILIFDGYLRFSKMSGEMYNFGIKTMVIGAIIFLLQRKIGKMRTYYYVNTNKEQ